MHDLGFMYLDTAIIVKLLVREPDSLWYDRALVGRTFETSELALTEVRSALLAKERAGAVTELERDAAIAAFRNLIDGGLVQLLPLDRRVVERAAAILLACHPQIPLRTLDALHIASGELHRTGPIATNDQRMRAACIHLGLAVFPSSLDEVMLEPPVPRRRRHPP